MSGPAIAPRPGEPRHWWENRAFAAALILLSVVPLLYPDIPPLVDLFGHMGRYRVQLDLATSEALQRYYDFQWAAIGNLGVDLLIVPLAPLVGLEMAVKLVVLAIPPLTVAGFLLVAREVHHRLPPTALFALPFVYSHPFLYGFVNFSLSMALAFMAFGLWLRLARLDRLRLRAILFVPISVILFFAHTFGWGTLGLLCFSAEAVRQHDRGAGWIRSGLNAALHASVMALPLAIMLAWRSETPGGMTHGWFDWELKLDWIQQSLRDRWRPFDLASLALALGLILFAFVNRRLTFSRNLAFSGLVLLAAFLCIPWTVFGSAFADTRLAPFVIAVGLLAIRFRDEMPLGMARTLAIAGLAFYAVRLAGTTASLAIASNHQARLLEAVEQIPVGARTVTLVGQACKRRWQMPRDTHIGSMVIVRRHGFANDQWVLEGTNMLTLRFPEAGRLSADPSQLVWPKSCSSDLRWSVDDAIGVATSGPFDYLWLIDVPPFDERLLAGAEPVWRSERSTLYRLAAG